MPHAHTHTSPQGQHSAGGHTGGPTNASPSSSLSGTTARPPATGQWVADVARFLVFPKKPGCVYRSLPILVFFSKSNLKRTKTKGNGEGSIHPGQGAVKAEAGLLPPPGSTRRRRGSCKGPPSGAGGAEHLGTVPTQRQTQSSCLGWGACQAGHPRPEAVWSSPGLPCPH